MVLKCKRSLVDGFSKQVLYCYSLILFCSKYILSIQQHWINIYLLELFFLNSSKIELYSVSLQCILDNRSQAKILKTISRKFPKNVNLKLNHALFPTRQDFSRSCLVLLIMFCIRLFQPLLIYSRQDKCTVLDYVTIFIPL